MPRKSAHVKPINCTFHTLMYSLQSLHVWNKADVDRLHDIWKSGAPTPNSIIRNPKIYDPRKPQDAVNHEARLVIPNLLEQWIEDVASRRGLTYQPGDAARIIEGMRIAWIKGVKS